MNRPAALTLIGSGIAGYTLAREWRKRVPDAPLRIITADDGAGYYKPNISKACASDKTAASLVDSSAEAQSGLLQAELLARCRVVAVDAAAHTLQVADAEGQVQTLPYSALVFATGADAILPPISAAAAVAVHTANDLDSYARLRSEIAPHSGARLLIIGGGLIGCEFANDFAASGVHVSVVDPLHWPIARLLPEACGRALQEALTALGVHWHFGCTVQALRRVDGVVHAELSDGRLLEADTVLCAAGLRPRTALAAAAGVACGNGIKVDAELRTNLPDVYAIGDCVEYPSASGAPRPRPYVLPITHAARALAATLAGTPTRLQLPPMPVAIKTPACPLIVCSPETDDGHWQISGSGIDLEARYEHADGRLLGFVLSGAARAQRTTLLPKLAAVF